MTPSSGSVCSASITQNITEVIKSVAYDIVPNAPSFKIKWNGCQMDATSEGKFHPEIGKRNRKRERKGNKKALDSTSEHRQGPVSIEVTGLHTIQKPREN